MKKLIAFLLSLFIFTSGYAQYYANYNKIWVFGTRAGIDFNSGSPVPIATGMGTEEGSASVCDNYGRMLFYTNGSEAYNRKNAHMPHGYYNITSYLTYSTTQATLIAPVIGEPGKYYLFSLQQANTSTGTYPDVSHLVYCIVDMSLDGGYGDVIPSTKNTPVANLLAEKMIAVTGNNHNIWLIAHARDTALFFAYEITSSGINTTPVTSTAGNFSGLNCYQKGVIKASPNRRRLVAQSMCQVFPMTGNNYGTEVYDFDPATGIVSNCIVLDSTSFCYGAEFSPDSKMLYTDKVVYDTEEIYQYVIDTASEQPWGTKTLIVQRRHGDLNDLKLAPNGKIYFKGVDTVVSNFLDCIPNPNNSGTTCGYNYHAVELLAGTNLDYGLLNLYVTEDTNYVLPNSLDNNTLPNGVLVFPNPSTTELTISSIGKIARVSIYNLSGEEVYCNEYDSEIVKVDISLLLPNIYFIKLNEAVVKQFVKL